ncbi:MAG: hypothetical protein HY842_10380 [Bacteroidetes bacterium]|nr:hypothetical protein [Bacteroidota bacterium]
MKLFAEFLLAIQEKKEQGKQATKRKGKFLEGLAHIPIPMDNLIIDRAEIYADRI